MDMQYVEHVLSDLHYPLTKEQILKEVENKGASEIVPLLTKLPEKKFGSTDEVLQEISASSASGLLSEL